MSLSPSDLYPKNLFTNFVQFSVCAAPVPQPRPKARRIGSNGIQIYTPQGIHVKAYKKLIADAYTEALGSLQVDLTSDIDLEVTFIIERPQNMCGPSYPTEMIPHNKKPDIDNLLKTVMDALNEVAWSDDSNVVNLSCRKLHAPIIFGGKSGRKRLSSGPRVIVTIKYLDIK